MTRPGPVRVERLRGMARQEVGLVVGLFLLAAAVRLAAAAQLPFPATEASAYYAGVAQNLVLGQGLVSDAVWSYATPPLEVPKPAFELWMPLSSLVSAAAMAVLGSSWWAAQVGSALLGALLALLAWALARQSARTAGLARRRASAVALASGLLAAVLGPFVINAATPDSYTPFSVAMLAAALLIGSALGLPPRPGDAPRRANPWAGLALGLALGAAYLARQEVIWLGLVVLVMLLRRPRTGASSGMRQSLAPLWPIVAGGLLVVLPWLLRNVIDLGSPFPGQAVENILLRRNEDIFAFADRPAVTAWLDQGLAVLLGNVAEAARAGLMDVLVLAAFPVGLVGLLAVAGLWHSPVLRHPGALPALLASGALTFLTTVLLFPVASLWGTWLHASGPLLVALTVCAALGADALLVRVSRWRGWATENVVIGPAALLLVTLLLGVLQLRLLAEQSADRAARYEAIGTAVGTLREAWGAEAPDAIMTDHPMWLATATGMPAIALPDEDLAAVGALARRFDAAWLVVIDERGRYPSILLDEAGGACLAAPPLNLLSADWPPAWLFELVPRCLAP